MRETLPNSYIRGSKRILAMSVLLQSLRAVPRSSLLLETVTHCDFLRPPNPADLCMLNWRWRGAYENDCDPGPLVNILFSKDDCRSSSLNPLVTELLQLDFVRPFLDCLTGTRPHQHAELIVLFHHPRKCRMQHPSSNGQQPQGARSSKQKAFRQKGVAVWAPCM